MTVEIYMLLDAIQFPNLNPFILGPMDVLGFPLGIRWYSLAYIVGLIAGIWLATRIARQWGQSVTPQDFDKLFIWIVLGVIGGGRLFFVLFYGLPIDPVYYSDPFNWLKAWDGGMSFHGGMFGVALAVIIYGSLKKNIRTLELGDLIAVVAPIGLFLGRLANFINGELWGRPTDLPWAVLFPRAVINDTSFQASCFNLTEYQCFEKALAENPDVMGRHPSQLYEAFLEGILLFVILQLMIRNAFIRAHHGILTGSFMLLYGIFRWNVEWVRQPDAGFNFLHSIYPGATMGQLLSIPMILIGASIIIWTYRRGPVKP